jgi:hypothetical protein
MPVIRSAVSVFAAVAIAGSVSGAEVAGASDSSKTPLPLKAVGTKILDSKDGPVLLRGVNAACLEWTSDGQGHILQSVNTAIRDWGVIGCREARAWSGSDTKLTNLPGA